MPRSLILRSVAPLVALVLTSFAVAGCGEILPSEDNGPPPDPMAANVVGARMIASSRAARAIAEAIAALGGTVVGRASSDGCYPGQNNWKLREGFDHRCTLRRSLVFGFDGDFRKSIARLDARLFAVGWGCRPSPCEDTLAGLVKKYWEFRKPEYGGNDPPISTLPTTNYERGDLHLDMSYVTLDRSSRSTVENWHRRRYGGFSESFTQSHPFDFDEVLARVSRYDYAIALAIEVDYFEDRDIG